MASFPLNSRFWGVRARARVCVNLLGEPSRIFCGLVNFPEMNSEIIVCGWAKSNNHKEG